MEDRDDKVRIAAVESLYNLSRILKELMLINITEIIEKMIMRAADHDDRNYYIYKFRCQKDTILIRSYLEANCHRIRSR